MSKKQIVVTAQQRGALGKGPARRLRRAAKVPAVVYGHGQAATALTLNRVEVRELLHHRGLVTLNLEGRSEPMLAILRDVQVDAASGGTLHVDFQEVRADEKVTVMVQIEPHGDPVGQSSGGQLERILHALAVRCLPADLPELLRIDVKAMKLDDIMHVRDLPLPAGVEAVTDPGQPVFQVRLPKIAVVAAAEAAAAEEEAAAAVAAPAAEEPEVIAKGKKPEEEGEKAAAKPEKAEKKEK